MPDSNTDWYHAHFIHRLNKAVRTPSDEQMKYDLWSIKNLYADVVAMAKDILAAAGLPTNVMAYAWKDSDGRWRVGLPPEGQRATCVYYLARDFGPGSKESLAAKLLYDYEQLIRSYEQGSRKNAFLLATRIGITLTEMDLGNLAVHGDAFKPDKGGKKGRYGPSKRLLLRICQKHGTKPSFAKVLEYLEDPILADSLLADDADPVTCVDVDFEAQKIEYNYKGRRTSVTFDRLEKILKYEI